MPRVASRSNPVFGAVVRDERLEAALVANPTDPAPCLVYADWLSERGEELLAMGYRTLGGEADSSKPDAQWAALMAVASAAWLLDHGDDDARPSLQTGVLDAIVACADTLSGAARAKRPSSLRPWNPPPLISRAVTALVEATFGLEAQASFGHAAPRARAAAPPDDFHRLFAFILHGAATTKRSPLERDDAFARSMNEPLTDDALEPVDTPLAPFSFDGVQISNSTTGVQGRVLRRGNRISARRAYAAMAIDLAGLTDDADGLEPDEKRELIDADVFMEEDPSWEAASLFTTLRQLFSLQASNEGGPVRTDGAASLTAALETFGALEAAASTTSEFPFTLLQFERAFVLLHIVY